MSSYIAKARARPTNQQTPNEPHPRQKSGKSSALINAEQQTYDELQNLLQAPTRDTSHHTSHHDGQNDHKTISYAHKSLRRLILTKTIPEIPGRKSLRPRIWKLLLRVDTLDQEDYLRWVEMGPSEVSTKIKNDTFRTLATDTQFKGRVKEDMLIRLLEAFIWKHHESDGGDMPFSYVQGMNVLSAPFLYIMPSQIEAFACFSTFIEVCCPLYVQPTLVGVHRGLRLLDKCLQFADSELYEYLRSKNLSAELYAFPSVLTLCACTPPLNEVLRLWDFLLAFGVHLNILCVVAQVIAMKEQILDSPSPMKVLRTFPALEAQDIILVAMQLAGEIPEDLYEELVRHPFETNDGNVRGGAPDRKGFKRG